MFWTYDGIALHTDKLIIAGTSQECTYFSTPTKCDGLGRLPYPCAEHFLILQNHRTQSLIYSRCSISPVIYWVQYL